MRPDKYLVIHQFLNSIIPLKSDCFVVGHSILRLIFLIYVKIVLWYLLII